MLLAPTVTCGGACGFFRHRHTFNVTGDSPTRAAAFSVVTSSSALRDTLRSPCNEVPIISVCAGIQPLQLKIERFSHVRFLRRFQRKCQSRECVLSLAAAAAMSFDSLGCYPLQRQIPRLVTFRH